MLYVPLQFRAYENQGLLDTGAIKSAMSENELRRILQAHPAAQLEEYPAPDFKVQIANGSIVPVRKQVLLRFFIGGKVFEETFMISPTMGNTLIGMSFFKKIFGNTRPRKQYCQIPRNHPSVETTKWEVQIANVGTQNITEDNHTTATTSLHPSGSRKGHRPCNGHG